MNEYAVLVDFAKKRDFNATMVMKDTPEIVPGPEVLGRPDRILHFYDILYIEQKQKRRYHEIAEDTVKLMRHQDLAVNADLLVDGTGVGEAVVEIMREKHLFPIPIITTGSGQVREVYAEMGQVFTGAPTKLQGARTLQEIHVPKADLVAAGQALMQQGRVRVARGLRWAAEFEKQLERFRGKINEKTHRKVYEAETEEDHDDLVICFLIGSWWFTSRQSRETIEERQLATGIDQPGDWNPYDHM